MEILNQNQNDFPSYEAIKADIAEDLGKVTENFSNTVSKVKLKLFSQIENQKEVFEQNYAKYQEMCQEFEGNLHESEKEGFEFMKNYYEKAFKRSAKYIRIHDESHSFHQVIQVLNKALTLFEEHIEDLLSLPNSVEINPENFIPKTLNDSRTHLLFPQKIDNVDLVFKGFIETEHEYPLNNILLFDDDLLVTSAADKSIHMYSVSKGTKVGFIKGLKHIPSAIKAILLPDFKPKLEIVQKLSFLDLRSKSNFTFKQSTSFLATGGEDLDPNIYIWNYCTSEKIITLPGHTRQVTSLCQLPDKNILVSGAYDSKIYFWDLTKAEPLFIQNNHSFRIVDIKVLSCLNKLASASWDRTIIIWKLSYEQKGRNFVFKDVKAERTLKDEYEPISISSSFSNNEILISTHIGSQIKIWNIKTGQTIKKIDLKRGFAIDFVTLESLQSVDEEVYLLLAFHQEGCIKIFSTKSGDCISCSNVENFSINSYNLSPKMQFYRNKEGKYCLLALNQFEGKYNIGNWEIVLGDSQKDLS